MKKLVSIMLAFMLCLSMGTVAFATETDMVPSISYKDEIEIVPPNVDEENVIGIIRGANGEIIDYIYADDCMVVTTIAQALRDVATGIPTDAESLLEEVYQLIKEGSMTLPFENPAVMVIRELLDITFLCEDSTVETDHLEVLQPEGVVLELIFNLGVAENVPVSVMTYKDGQWIEIVSATNNGDGTVTCVFEHLCPVAIAVPTASVEPPATGDENMGQIDLWIALMVASGVTLIGLVVFRRKAVR